MPDERNRLMAILAGGGCPRAEARAEAAARRASGTSRSRVQAGTEATVRRTSTGRTSTSPKQTRCAAFMVDFP